ncbi:MAG: hypothetical protein ACRC7N_14585 [Clostridium sp.]
MSLIDKINKVTIDKTNIVKTIRFSEDEAHLLKYLIYRKRRFSEYLKELLHRDFEEFIKENDMYSSRDEIIEIVREEVNSLNQKGRD